jgi:hypothetical protein
LKGQTEMALTKLSLAHPRIEVFKSFNRFTQIFVPGAADVSATGHGSQRAGGCPGVGSLPHPVSIKVTDETMPSGLGITGSAV